MNQLHPIFAQALAPFMPSFMSSLRQAPKIKATDDDEPPEQEDEAEESNEEEGEGYCPNCSGSGEGRYDGTDCYACGGSGVAR